MCCWSPYILHALIQKWPTTECSDISKDYFLTVFFCSRYNKPTFIECRELDTVCLRSNIVVTHIMGVTPHLCVISKGLLIASIPARVSVCTLSESEWRMCGHHTMLKSC